MATLIVESDRDAGGSAPLSGGGVAAAAGALAAALARTIAAGAVARQHDAHIAGEMQTAAQRAATLAGELSTLSERDTTARDALAAAHRLPKAVGDAPSTRYGVLQRALIVATESPLAIAHAAADVAALSAAIAEMVEADAIADATVATLLAECVCRASALTVRANVAALADTALALHFKEAVQAYTETADRAVARALAAAEREC